MNPGDLIRLERKKKGISQRKLAALVGVSPAAIAQWEGGGAKTKTPMLKNIIKAFSILGIPLDLLLTGQSKPTQLTISDLDEIALISLFQQMDKRTRKTFLALFYDFAARGPEVVLGGSPDEESNPSDRLIVGRVNSPN